MNFFNQPYLADKIELGATLAVFGKWDRAKASLTGMKVLAQVEDDLQPVYRLAQGISQASLVKVIKTAFDQGLDLLIEENLPQSLLDKYKLMSRCQAVRAMHFPKDLGEYKQALRRIKFEELFYFQMQLQTLKSENRVQGSGLVLDWSQEKVTAVKESLPFALTQAQENEFAGNFNRHEVGPPHESSPTRGCGERKNGGRWLGHVCSSDSWLPGCSHGANRNPCRATF